MAETSSLELLETALERLRAGFAELPAFEETFPLSPSGRGGQGLRDVLNEVADRLHDNYPYFHPLYAGQMLKPPHPVARLAYELALWINPNNHALDGGRASSAMEKEAVAELARMVGWGSTTHLGHLCGGGTMANLEALWVAGQLQPGKTVVASSQAHYTHRRIAGVLGLPFDTIPCDRRGRMDVPALERRLAAGGVGTVVATMGTTATGAVDPLDAMLALRKRYDFRVHADAAYGGYFTLVSDLAPETRAAFDGLHDVASIVIDPHKHGLQPYGCGCVIFRDPSVGRLYRHDSPYTYYTSSELHLGEISLECSRPGAAAVALWATQRLLPLVRDGAFATGLAAGRAAAVTWAPAYPASHPLRDCGQWFRRHLPESVNLHVVTAEADLLPALNGARGVIISGSPRDAWNDDPVNARLCGLVHACRLGRSPPEPLTAGARCGCDLCRAHHRC